MESEIRIYMWNGSKSSHLLIVMDWEDPIRHEIV